MSLFTELKRRNVFRVGIAYLVLSWLLLQVADVLIGIAQLPEWSLTLVAVILALGFLPALVFSWIYEMTPEGLKRESEIDRSASITHHTARKLDIAVILMLVGVGALVLVGRGDMPESARQAQDGAQAPAARAELDRSVAVLPFADMSQDGDQAYFADGVSEEILNALTRLPGLKVAGRTSSFKFRGVNEDLRLIGEQLGVANILEGSVRKSNNRVRVTVQLIDASNGFHLWSETFDRELQDIFAVQDQISQAVAQALSVAMDIPAHTEPTGPRDVDAHDHYFQARRLLATRLPNDLKESIRLFEAATGLAPEFDQAWSGLARARALTWDYLNVVSADSAREAANRALSINPDNAEAYSVLSTIAALFDWDWEAALTHSDMAVRKGPNNAEIANFAGDVFRIVGQEAKALEWEQRAAELDPLHAVNHTDLSWAYMIVRHCENAARSASASLALQPDFVPGIEVLGRAQVCLGELDSAHEALERMRQVASPRWHLGLRGELAMAEGRDDELRELIEEAGEYMHSAFFRASLLAILGEFDRAASLLEQAHQEREPILVTDPAQRLPEHWPDHPGIRAALDKPDLNALWEMRRRGLLSGAADG